MSPLCSVGVRAQQGVSADDAVWLRQVRNTASHMAHNTRRTAQQHPRIMLGLGSCSRSGRCGPVQTATLSAESRKKQCCLSNPVSAPSTTVSNLAFSRTLSLDTFQECKVSKSPAWLLPMACVILGQREKHAFPRANSVMAVSIFFSSRERESARYPREATRTLSNTKRRSGT